MSESKPSSIIQGRAITATEADKNEFVVHKKHGCNKCYIKPIIGRRYRSNAICDYDLCEACFEAQDGPKIGLTEVLLARDRETKNTFALKLKIDGGTDSQTRRLNVADLWDSSNSTLSFAKLIGIASDFAFNSRPAEKLEKVKVTYIDEDGDKITMSSDEELMEAFRQTLKKFPARVFRINATFPKEQATPKAPPVEAKKVEEKRVDAPSKHEETKCLAQRPQRGVRCVIKGKGVDVSSQVYDEKFFIHARHTCDGCSKTPIIGTRYHATKIPDFDLCETCFKEYKGEDLDFKPEIFDRDRPMQPRWLKKQLSMTQQVSPLSDILKKLKEVNATASVQAKVAPKDHICGDNDCKNADKSVTTVNEGLVSNAVSIAKEVSASGTVEDPPTPSKISHKNFSIEDASVSTLGGTSESKPVGAEKEHSVAGTVKISSPQSDVSPGGSILDDVSVGITVAAKESKSAIINQASTTGIIDEPSSPSKISVGGSIPDDVSVTTKPASVKGDSISGSVQESSSSSKCSAEESFLDDADGNGSIAEVIGRTLDVFVQAMDEVVCEIEKTDIGTVISEAKSKGAEKVNFGVAQTSFKSSDTSPTNNEPKGEAGDLKVANTEAKTADNATYKSSNTSAAEHSKIKAHDIADTFSVASSMISSMTDVIKKVEEGNKSAGCIVPFSSPKNEGSRDVPSVVSGATILQSVKSATNESGGAEDTVENENSDTDEWSVIEDEKRQAEGDETLAKSLSMIGSALFDSDMTTSKPDIAKDEEVSASSASEALSSGSLARWETELKQLREMGFLDDRKNVDALENLEAAHIGVDSTDKVSVTAAVDYLLRNGF
mmetsp:Transcript_28335/g.58858  ORF Transcript_28335/g.58858 Transcript_28335/m.58858 type:complete len:834 (+) Transcript_28335:345-2846(+)